MSAPATRRGQLLIAAALLLLSVLLEQYCIAPFFPRIGDTGSFRPMLVFLDIPLALPTIDWLPVSILFVVLYSIVIAPVLTRGGQRARLGITVWKALSGWWLLLIAIAAGGSLYYMLQDLLPKQVGNGIDSFGVRADLSLPWPSGGLLHLHGSMVQLVFAAIGLHIFSRNTRIAQPVVHETAAVEAAVAEARAIISNPPATRKVPATPKVPATVPKVPTTSKVPAAAPKVQAAVKKRETAPVFSADENTGPHEPPTCRLTTPPPIAVVIPRPAPGIGKMHPCVVNGAIKPSKA